MALRGLQVEPLVPPITLMIYFVYILEDETMGRFYVGQTKNLQERINDLNANESLSLKVSVPTSRRAYSPVTLTKAVSIC
jgi:predicted GIY-YIG superfamily endonuclease